MSVVFLCMSQGRPIFEQGSGAAGAMVEPRIYGTGEMARLIRSKDWSATPLGAIGTWSETLLATVNILLLSPFSFALYWGAELTLLYNDAYRPFLAEKHPEALGGAGPVVWREAWSVIGPPIESAHSNGIATSATETLIPILVDGQLQDRWWTYGFYPVYENGRIAGVANPGNDDTERMMATRKRRRAELANDRLRARLETILDGTMDGIALVDRSWCYTYFNKAGMRIARVDETVIGRNIWEAFPGMVYDGSPFVYHHTRAMDEGIAGDFVTTYANLDDMTLRVFSLPVPDGIIVIFRDITEQQRDTDVLIQTEKLAAVGRLASSVAHEINNPLESVTNLLYLIRSTNHTEQIHDYAETAERELRRVGIITSQTLRFHRQATHSQLFFCHDLIGESLSLYQGRLVNSKIEVLKRKRAKQPIDCFGGEIRQVLSNLIGNAIDAMPTGGHLLVRSREAMRWATTSERGIVLTVADTGTGISAAIQRKMFNPFFTTKGIGGTGLGLWISSEIVARHRGTLRVRSSQREGRSGTVVTLFLPFKAQER